VRGSVLDCRDDPRLDGDACRLARLGLVLLEVCLVRQEGVERWVPVTGVEEDESGEAIKVARGGVAADVAAP
jgi:hypothetical protein